MMGHDMNEITTISADHGAHHGAGTARRAGRAAPGAPSAPCPPALPEGHGGRKARSPAAARTPHGAAHGALHGAGRIDADYVVSRLEEAGTALLALPNTGHSPRLRTSTLDVVRSALEGYGWEGGKLRPPVPDAACITRMDEALGWIPRIPIDRYVLRRIVGARALVSPVTERHLFPWRRLGTLLGADHKAVQRWHAQGIALIVESLNAGLAATG